MPEKITADTEEGYTLTQQRLILCAQFLAEVDLDGMIARMNTAETVTPILNPTLYMRGGDQMRLLGDVAVAGRTFQKAWATLCKEYPALEDQRRKMDPLRGCDPNEFDKS